MILIMLSVTLLTGLTKDQAINQVLFTSVKKGHFSPIEIDDSYSEKVFDLYMKRIDPRKRFLTQTDYEQLSGYKLLIDDQLKEGSDYLYSLSIRTVSQRINQVKKIYPSFLKFQLVENFEFDSNKDYYLRVSESFGSADIPLNLVVTP